MARFFCYLVGCHWVQSNFLPEDDPRWNRYLWKCSWCGDTRKVWIGYNGNGRPDRFYREV